MHREGLVSIMEKSLMLFVVGYEDLEVVCRLARAIPPLEGSTLSLVLRQLVMLEVSREKGVVFMRVVQPRVEALTTVEVF